MEVVTANKSTDEIQKDAQKKKSFDDVGELLQNLPTAKPIIKKSPVCDNGSPTVSKPRGRPKGSVAKKTIEKAEKLPKPEHVKMVFDGINILLEHFKKEPLSDQEIKEGVASWFPLYKLWFPSVGGESIYFAPVVWSGSMVMSRCDFSHLFKKKDKDKESEVSEPDQSTISEPQKQDWTNSEKPGE